VEDYPAQESSLPIKMEKDCELTTDEKEYIRNHSKRRIVMEHVIYKLKKFKIVKDVFRNRLRRYYKA